MKHWYVGLIALALVVAVPIAPLWPSLSLLGLGSAITPVQSAGTRTLLPIAPRGLRMDLPRPEITITSPASGSALSGTMIFQAQAADPKAVASVTFMAGSKVLATDTSSADGFKTFVKASDYPSGTLRLIAIALGTNGATTTQTVSVDVQRQVPASGAVAATGATLGTQSGGRLVVPPGAAPAGTTITVKDRSKDEVKKMTGIDYDALGITFLGAMQVDSKAVTTGPLEVSTAGFGSRVKPGDAVLTFQIAPDRDGDGVGELVMVSGATVAPDGTVLTNPVPAVVVNSQTTSMSASGRSVLAGLGGPPGAIFRVQGSGVNPGSVFGTLGVFKSAVDGKEIAVPGFASSDIGGSASTGAVALTPESDVTIAFAVPPLTPGAATLTITNREAGMSASPISVTIDPPVALGMPAAAIIDDFFAKGIAFLNGLNTTSRPGLATYREAAVANLGKTRSLYQQLSMNTDPTVQQFITQSAQMIEGSGLRTRVASGAASTRRGADLSTFEETFLKDYGTMVGASGAVAAAFAKLGAETGAAAALASAAPILAGVALGVGIAFAVMAAYFFYQKYFNPCNPSPLDRLSRSISGAGSAPPPGGVGCASMGGASRARSAAARRATDNASPMPFDQDASGRYVVRVFANGGDTPLTPFTGESNRVGYAFVPLIPAGRAFTALAIDTWTGQRSTFQGIGPATGDAVFFLFDFADTSTTQLTLGQATTTTGVAAGAAPKAFSFTGTAGRVMSGSYSWSAGGADDPALSFEITSPKGTSVTTFSANAGGASGSGTIPEFKLAGGGPYAVTVTPHFTGTGSYTFQLTELTATVSAAASAVPGTDFAVKWTGPNAGRDEIRIVAKGAENSAYKAWRYTSEGSTLMFRAPDESGDYEIRYVTGSAELTVASTPLTVTRVTTSVSASASAAAGAALSVTWVGPNNSGDEIDIVPTGGSNDDYVAWTSTSDGTPAVLRAPDTAGSYEVRYVSGQDRLTWAAQPLTVTTASASVSAPSPVGAGASLAVSWTGPSNDGDEIRIVPTGGTNDDYVAWTSTSDGNPARLIAPAAAGSYELRYVSGQSSLTWASQPLTVGAVAVRDQSRQARRR